VGLNIMIYKILEKYRKCIHFIDNLGNKINNMSTTMVDEDQKDSIFVEGFSCKNKKYVKDMFCQLKVSNTQFLQGH
jgi:dimeric dUTPase (all-alpha-NTP-PPase superfamily)